jgi:hypothetical protein
MWNVEWGMGMRNGNAERGMGNGTEHGNEGGMRRSEEERPRVPPMRPTISGLGMVMCVPLRCQRGMDLIRTSAALQRQPKLRFPFRFTAKCVVASRVACETRKSMTTGTTRSNEGVPDDGNDGCGAVTAAETPLYWRATIHALVQVLHVQHLPSGPQHSYKHLPHIPVPIHRGEVVFDTEAESNRSQTAGTPHSRAAFGAEPPLHLVLVRAARGEPLGLAFDVHGRGRAH